MNPIGQQPIQDVTPPHDSLGNPEQFADVPVRQSPGATPDAATNPIAGGAPLQPPRPQPAAKKDDVDKVLKEVNKEVKAASQKPWTPSKPVIQIVAAVFVAAGLSVAAFFAFRQPG